MSFLVRWVHVASVSLLFGGALLLFAYAFWRSRHSIASGDSALFDLMRLYEAGFWVALGLIVMTGIGNLGAMGEGLPDRGSPWGGKLALKLVLVAVLLVVSAVRTLSVAMLAGRPASTLSSRLGGLYGATAIFVSVIVGVAVSLAHYPDL